jgi:maltose-binding protein MalE
VKRLGLNRLSLWQSKEFAQLAGGMGTNFLQASIDSMRQDLDVDWRPKMPQWPAVGETMATAIQAALVGQQKPKEALDEAQTRIAQILKG